MPEVEETLGTDSASNHSNGWFEKKVPVAVLVLLVAQFVTGIWAASAFYTKQTQIAERFDANFLRIDSQIVNLEQKMYTRQEATIQLESIRQTNARQDEEIRDLNKEFRDVLIKQSQK